MRYSSECDRPPTRSELSLLADCVILDTREALIKPAIAIGAHAADGNEDSADYTRETRARVERELTRELKEFVGMVGSIENPPGSARAGRFCQRSSEDAGTPA
jgi:hypothetical protein